MICLQILVTENKKQIQYRSITVSKYFYNSIWDRTYNCKKNEFMNHYFDTKTNTSVVTDLLFINKHTDDILLAVATSRFNTSFFFLISYRGVAWGGTLELLFHVVKKKQKEKDISNQYHIFLPFFFEFSDKFYYFSNYYIRPSNTASKIRAACSICVCCIFNIYKFPIHKFLKKLNFGAAMYCSTVRIKKVVFNNMH